MIDTDIGDHSEFGAENVRGIEAPAQSGFNDCVVDLLPSEMLEGQRRD